MNPGMLKHRIAFLQKSETVRDELGGKMPAMYSEVFKLWAAKSERPTSRRELMGEHVNYVPVFFTVRRCSGAKMPDVTMRIRCKNLIYELLNISDLDNGYLEIETKLVKPL